MVKINLVGRDWGLLIGLPGNHVWHQKECSCPRNPEIVQFRFLPPARSFLKIYSQKLWILLYGLQNMWKHKVGKLFNKYSASIRNDKKAILDLDVEGCAAGRFKRWKGGSCWFVAWEQAATLRQGRQIQPGIAPDDPVLTFSHLRLLSLLCGFLDPYLFFGLFSSRHVKETLHRMRRMLYPTPASY